MQFPEPIGGLDSGGRGWEVVVEAYTEHFFITPMPAELHICVLLGPLKRGSALLWAGVMAAQVRANHQFI